VDGERSGFQADEPTLDSIEKGIFTRKLELLLPVANASGSLSEQALAAASLKPGGADAIKRMKDKNAWLSLEYLNPAPARCSQS
jgi:hypothetical protein